MSKRQQIKKFLAEKALNWTAATVVSSDPLTDDEKEGLLAHEEPVEEPWDGLISSTTEDLGVCVIDIYRAPGDLYDSWDIVPCRNGRPHRLPDARYGVDQPDYGELTVDDFASFESLHLFRVIEKWDVSGWTVTKIIIKDDTGRTIASRDC